MSVSRALCTATLAAVLVATTAMTQPARVELGRFSAGALEDWTGKSFQGETDYRLVELDGRRVLRAMSRDSASGLFREQTVDLAATPWLHWRWRVDRLPAARDETTREGDDFAARIYVVVDGGLAFWRTRALNYVWTTRQPVGSQWPNPFAGENVTMLAVRSGDQGLGRWHSEKRNVREDLRRIFGRDIRRIDALALMTDTDNGGGEALAYYGDIRFSADPGP